MQTFPHSTKPIELGAKISVMDIEKSISGDLDAKIRVADTEESISADLEANISGMDIEKSMNVPDGLLCPVCRELIKDAVMCPENVCEMCDNCARKDLNSKCPVCFESITLDELIPNRKTRLAVEFFRNSLTISELAKGFEKGVLKYKNKHNTENKNGTEQEIVLEEETEMFEKDFEMDLPFYGYTSSPIKPQFQTPTPGYTVKKCSADFCGQMFSSDEKLKQHETEHIQSHPLEYEILPFFVPKTGSPTKPITGINLKTENGLADKVQEFEKDFEMESEKDFEMEFEKDFKMKFEEDLEMHSLEYKMLPFFVPKTGSPKSITGINKREKIEKAPLLKLKGVWKKSKDQQRRKRYVKALWSKK